MGNGDTISFEIRGKKNKTTIMDGSFLLHLIDHVCSLKFSNECRLIKQRCRFSHDFFHLKKFGLVYGV